MPKKPIPKKESKKPSSEPEPLLKPAGAGVISPFKRNQIINEFELGVDQLVQQIAKQHGISARRAWGVVMRKMVLKLATPVKFPKD